MLEGVGRSQANVRFGSKPDMALGIDPKVDEFGRDFRQSCATTLRPTILNRDGTSFDPAEIMQTLDKGGGSLGLGRSCRSAQEAHGR
jgi:hypothetical protein